MAMKRNRCHPAAPNAVFQVTAQPDTITKLQLEVVPGQGAAGSPLPACGEIVSERRAAVRVQVSDRSGLPVGGVWVGLYLRTGIRRSLLLSSRRTGPDGGCQFSPVDVGAYLIKAHWVEQEGSCGRMRALEDAAAVQIGEELDSVQAKLRLSLELPG